MMEQTEMSKTETLDSEITRRQLFKVAGAAGLAALFSGSMLMIEPELAFAANVTKCYTIANRNTTVYRNTGLTKKHGTIYPTDEVTVLSIGKSYCRVQYPISGGTKTGYISTNALVLGTSGPSYTYHSKVTTYRRNSTGKSYGYVAVNDRVVVLGTKGKFT